ncbi:MAG: hypothetical protein LBG47_06325 [Prevotellaceae bacterium]|jgi:hypothetical protein|nr:hypothetical protein [Prevotellaceae bacterium]
MLIIKYLKTELDMKKIVLTAMVFAFVANVSAQLKVDANGQVGIGTASPQYKLDVTGNSRFAGNIYLGGYTNFIGMPTDVSLSFKVNGTLAGYTGSSDDYNVSFGYNAFSSNIIGDLNTAFGYEALVNNWMGGQHREWRWCSYPQ